MIRPARRWLRPVATLVTESDWTMSLYGSVTATFTALDTKYLKYANQMMMGLNRSANAVVRDSAYRNIVGPM